MKRTFHLRYYKAHGLSICLFLVVKVKGSNSLREKCPNTEFFLVQYLTVFGQNTGKYGPEKTPYMDTFHEMILEKISDAKLF